MIVILRPKGEAAPMLQGETSKDSTLLLMVKADTTAAVIPIYDGAADIAAIICGGLQGAERDILPAKENVFKVSTGIDHYAVRMR
jgi:hypothetical protein